MDSAIVRTPSEINGYPVVAMVKLPHISGNLPDAHVVVCESRSIARETTYTVWSCAWQQIGDSEAIGATGGACAGETASAGHWAADNGHYDMTSLDRALIVMSERAGNYIHRGL